MKKQCTASSCRRLFDTSSLKEKKCPFCGKEYPRLKIGSPPPADKCFRLRLTSYPKDKKLSAAHAVMTVSGRGLDSTLKLMKELPIILLVKGQPTELRRKEVILQDGGWQIEKKRVY